jgi:glycolate oxidase FAD binding subunit
MGEIELFASTLQSQVPHAQTITDVNALQDYTVDGVMPRIVVTPTTVEEAAQIVALTGQQGLKLLPRGGGSRMNVGGLPEQIDVLLETNKLNRLLEHEAPDLTCSVEAGITLAALQAQLATKGQKLSLDPPDAAQATVGGVLASNASGPKRLRYGTARELMISLRAIQASGEIATGGGHVVKNVADYDLNKLYIGTLGTFGVIVAANFKLHPLPPAERTLLLTYANAADTMQTVIDILGSVLTPGALELIDGGAASDMTDFFGLNLPTNGYTLAVNFEGSLTAIDRQMSETRLIARKNNAVMEDDLQGTEQERFWNAIREHTQGTLTCKVAILPSQIVQYLQQVERICRHHNLEAAIVAHAGNGVLYIELRPGDATPRLIEAIGELRRHAQEVHGSLIVERCPVDLKHRISVWGEPRADFQLMQRLKQQFDPKGTFVKGRFLGGL